MPRPRCYILLMLCLLLPAATMAQVGEKTSFGLKPGDEGTYQLLFRTSDMTFSAAEDNYVALSGYGMVGLAPSEGLPALPQASRLLTLPRGTALHLERWQAGEAEPVPLPEGKLLSPWQGATVKEAEPMPVEPDKATYATDGFLRWGAPVEVEDLGAMGDRQLFRVTVRPVAYNPVRGEVAIAHSISATLSATSSPLLVTSTSLPERYLVVSRPQFREGLQPFVRWKLQEGYDVVELYADTNKCDSVKALIAPWFADRAPRYLLLVGDAAQLQAFTGTTRPSGLNLHTTDLYYAEHSGDYLPDALTGRWPVNDTAELRAVVEKTLRYEQGGDLDTGALSRILLVAGSESQSPAPVTTNGQVNYIGRELKNALPGIDTLCYRNPASSTQRGAILADMGRSSFVNYTAHCTTAGWSNPAVTFASIDTLETAMPLFYVNNCCLSNSFGGTCFGEQLLRKPHGGAAGVIGATNSTLWNEDYYWAVGPKYPFSTEPQYDSLRPGAFDRWIGGEAVTAGGLLVAGNLAVTAFGSPYDRFYWEIYCLFGDPSMVPWAGVPQQVQLSVADTVAVGTTEVSVGGTRGAVVTAMQGDSLLGIARLDGDGNALLQLNRPTDTVPVLFTATLARWLPTTKAAACAMPRGKALTFRQTTLTDTAVDFTLENIGTDTLYAVAAIAVPASDSTDGALFTSGQLSFDTLLPQESQQVHLPLHIDTWAPLLDVCLTATDSDGDSWRLRKIRHLTEPLPELSFSLATTDSQPAASLERNGEYLVGIIATGVYDSVHCRVTVLPGGTVSAGTTGWLAATTGDNSTHLKVEGYISHGLYSRGYEYYLTVGNSTDGFADGLSAYPWQSGGTLPWTVDSTVSHTGRYSLRSGAIDYRQTSDLAIEFLMPSDDSISFWLRTSTEPNYDKLSFSIDGAKVFDAWGESAWRRYSYPLAAGHHTLLWRYTKDESTSEGSDCAWIDDVRLPLALWPAPCAAQSDEGHVGISRPSVATASLSLYPNPAADIVTVEADGFTMEELRVADIYGRTVYSTSMHSAAAVLNLSTLPVGVYFVETRSDTVLSRARLIIQRH